MAKLFWILISVSIIVFSCSKEEEAVEPDTSSDYAGMVKGKYVIYNVDSVTYDDFNGTIDTVSYQIKEVVDSDFIDLENEEALKIIRYKRYSDTLSWDLIDVWSGKISHLNFRKTEENIKYVKLTFPVKTSKTWNGNSMNNLTSEEYKYKYIDKLEVIGGISLTQVLRVTQGGEDGLQNLINPTFFEEKYAKGIGMVYKRSTDKVRTGLSNPWKGYDVTYVLSSYGS
jgi:hypothetical protein